MPYFTQSQAAADELRSADINRYLEIVAWARRRYTRNGFLAVSVGGTPTAYTRIENAAFKKYHWRA